MKIKRIFPILLTAVLVIFSGCENNTIVKQQEEQITISLSWWGNDERNEYTIEAVKQFEALHPDIKVKCSYSEWSGYVARNNVQMISNTESDVMQINYAWLEQYSPDGTGYYDISTLSDYIDFSNFSETEIAYGLKNGKLNALPIALNTETIYINKTIYDDYGLDVPKTWDDIFHAAEVMQGKNYPISMNNKSSFFYTTAYAEEKTGRKIINEDGTLGFTPEDISIMLDFYCQLINKNVMPQVEYFDKLAIESGEYAGVIAWLSDAEKYMKPAIENEFEIVVADYPSYDNKINWYIKPATMYAISDNTEYPKESAMLLDFLLNSNEMAEFQGIEKGIPMSKSARKYLEDNDRLNGIQYDAFVKMNEFSDKLTLISPYMEDGDLLDNFNNACNDVLFEKKELLEASEELYHSFCDILKKYQD